MPPGTPLLRVSLLSFWACTWLVFRPYFGIFHDARLYAFQALQTLEPARFSQDLYFLYGSQGAFTLFSRVHGLLAGALGIGPSTKLLVVVSQIIFLLGLWSLSRVLLRGGPRWIFLFAVAVLPAFYINLQLAYAESFLSARPAAEGVVLLALTRIIGGQLLSAALLGIVAAAIHPIVAATGALVAVGCLAADDRRWLAAPAVAAAAALVLGRIGLAPFSALFESLGPDWPLLGPLGANVAFPASADMAHWFSIVWGAVVVGAALPLTQGRQRRFLLAVSFAAIIGYAVTCIGSDLLANSFLTQLQLHRSLWLFHIGSYLALTRLIADGIRRGEVAVIALTWLLTARLFPPLPVSVALLAGFVVLTVAQRRKMQVPAWVRVPAWLPLPLWAAGGLWASRIITLPVPTIEDYSFRGRDPHAVELLLATPALVALGLVVLLLIRQARRVSPPIQIFLALSGLAFLTVAVVSWDQRPDENRAMEARYGEEKLLASVIRPGANVYWDDRHLLHVWFLLDSPSYFSSLQLSGLVFSPETGREWIRRLNIIRQMTPDELAGHDPAPELPVDELGRVCASAPNLDYVVTSEPGPRSPTPFDLQGSRYYLNDCLHYRRSFNAPGGR